MKLLHKKAHDKRGITESLHVYINRAKLTACEMGVFSRYKVWLLILLLQHHVFTFLLIGRGGQRIRELEDASGARIKVHIAYLLCSKS